MRARIRNGAIVWMDMSAWRWPDMPRAKPDFSFETTQGQRPDTFWCRRYGFGVHGSRKSYGNGAILAENKDLIPVKERRQTKSSPKTE